MSLAELIRARRSIRKYNSTPVDQELVVELLRKANRLQPFAQAGSWRVVYAGTSEARKRLVDCMLEQMSQSRLGKLIPGKLLDIFKRDLPIFLRTSLLCRL